MTRLPRPWLWLLSSRFLPVFAALALTFTHYAGAERAGGPGQEKPALAWVEDLKSPSQGTRTRATSALAKFRPTPPGVADAVADLLAQDDWSVRAQALTVLGNMRADASIVLPQILAALDDENEHVRRAAASVLPRIPADTHQTRLALVRALGSDDRYLRSQAGYALAAVAADSGDIASELARLATSDNRQASGAAFNALEKLPADITVPLLIPLLRSEDDQVRQNTARILGAFGPDASAAVPTLIALLDEYPHYSMAIHTLGRIGPGAKEAIPALLALYERSDPSRQLRLAATGALVSIGPEPRTVLPLFRDELAQQDMSEAAGGYRATLAAAILLMSGPQDPAIQAYVKRLARDQRSWQPMTRVEAVKGLLALGPAAAPAMDVLRESLRKDKEPKIRALAAEALGGIGGAALPALPDLRTAQQEDEAYVSRRASAAIARIEASARTTPPDTASTTVMQVDEREERQKEIAADIAALSISGSRQTRASLRLLERASESLPAMHQAVLSPDTSPRDRSRLIALLQDLGDPGSVDVILQAVRAHPDQAGLRYDALQALGELPQTQASYQFASQSLDDARETPQVRRKALLYFARQRDPRGARWAERLRSDDDPYMRITALYLAASLGDETARQPITTLLREQPQASGRYALLLALGELTDPAVFEQVAGATQAHDDEYDSALRLVRLRFAQGKARVVLARQMLDSRFPNERRIAMDHLLKANAVNELTPLLAQWGQVPPHTRAAIAAGLYRGGYRIVERDRSLEIQR